ncbi:hypothetical protein PHMEG_00014515 [Phytophthora megakarya]|uniref:Uncharacterized protein n=1 Tax=Phytophthora megakarya TaxID=4795 RepID=A0A225W453_9STRA|nr:hypothetical protein PHMEG_00014515 [Phytophthora megakarya]
MAKTTRNTARRLQHSDTVPARHLMVLEDALQGGNAYIDTNEGRDGSQQQMEYLETGIADLRQEFAAAQHSLKVEVTVELTHMSSSLGTELSEVKGHLANLVQGELETNPDKVSDIQQAQDVPMMAMDGTVGNFSSATMMNGLRLRKMDVSPPTFDGLIDGIKLNSFIFQFESYFQQKGYNLTQHDHLLPHELNQCDELVWYERYMTDDITSKLWSIMNGEMVREFRFREFQRVVGLNELTAINVFVNGLRSAQMRIAIQRKQPMTLTAAVQEGFLEWELQDKPTPAAKGETHSRSSTNKPNGGYQKCGFGKAVQHSNKPEMWIRESCSAQERE